jgi:hypothetical protein
MTRLLAPLAVAFALVLAGTGCSGGNHPSASAQAGSSAGAPRELHSIGELRAAFNAHAGEPRLIVLVSPT